jgi:hypothetical protein
MVPCVLTFIIIAFVYMSWRGRATKLQTGSG